MLILCGGAAYMAWAIHRDSTAEARELAARVAAQAAADRAAARPAGPDDAAQETRLRLVATRSPDDAARFATWLISRQRDKDALGFVDQLPEALRTAAAVRDRRAELLARGGQRDDLRAALLRGDWGRMDPFALQLAFAAQTAARTAHSELAADLWQASLRAGAASRSTESALQRLGQIWARQGINQAFLSAATAAGVSR